MQPFQVLTLFLGIVVVLLQFRFMRRCKDKRLLAIPDLMWALHVIIFYTVIAVDPVREPGEYTNWSSSLRLHAMLTLLTMSLYRFFKEHKK